MPSITIWNRIEPRCRSFDFNSGLEARVYDPLWLLGRQWQVGEFEARDAGSPVLATVQSSTTLLDRFSIANGAVQTLDRTRPIEMLVEAETVRPAAATNDFRQAIEAGLYFLRLAATKNLPQTIIASYLAQYRIDTATGEAQPISSAAAGRVIDGIKLYADLKAAGNKLPALPAIPSNQHDAVLAVTREWMTWYTGLFSDPAQGNGWSPDRMEYSFAVAPGTTNSYVAQEYDGGAVDWYTFNRSTKSLAGAAAQPSTSSKAVAIAPVTFKAMPARRFWEMEDAAANVGQLTAAAEDLGRLLLRDFALIYGNDWFQIPLVVPAGSKVDIPSLSVSDTFGIAIPIPHYSTVDGPGGHWRMFALSAQPGDPPVIASAALPHELLVTSSAVAPMHGAPTEEVLLLRDEIANVVWGIERTVLGPSGQSFDRTTAWNTSLPVTPPPSANATPQYRLGSSVPDYWIPFLPVRANAASALKLQRGRLPTASSGPLGLLLAYPNMTLFLEEVPREGVHLERRYRFARASDGSPCLWVGRYRDIGRREGRSGLRFDYLE